MKTGDLVTIRVANKAQSGNTAPGLPGGELELLTNMGCTGLIVRKVPFYEMQGKVGKPYDPWYEVLMCGTGELKIFKETYLRFVNRPKV